jgi:hypothetical protein
MEDFYCNTFWKPEQSALKRSGFVEAFGSKFFPWVDSEGGGKGDFVEDNARTEAGQAEPQSESEGGKSGKGFGIKGSGLLGKIACKGKGQRRGERCPGSFVPNVHPLIDAEVGAETAIVVREDQQQPAASEFGAGGAS